jgi:hypothetical protein
MAPKEDKLTEAEVAELNRSLSLLLQEAPAGSFFLFLCAGTPSQ